MLGHMKFARGERPLDGLVEDSTTRHLDKADSHLDVYRI